MNYFTSMFRNLISLLYNKYVYETDEQIARTSADVNAYCDTSKENIIAIVANALSSFVVSDLDISITGDSKRAKMLQEITDRYFNKLKARTADCLGTGLLVSIPYSAVVGNQRKIFIDSVMKDRFFITGISGDVITSCTVVADYKVIREHKYIRFTDYSLDGNTYVIKQRAVRDSSQISLDALPDWKGIPEEIRIGGVDRLPIGIMRCPTSNRRPDTPDGVPVTYGCGATLKKIENTLTQIEKEYEKKEATIFADETLFDGKDQVSKLYKLVSSDNEEKPFFEIFSPEIRQSAFYEKLSKNFKMLETQIGCSGGILSEIETKGATATEIKRAMSKTFSFCTDVQNAIERYYNDLMYGCNVLANYLGLTPDGKYDIKYSWSYALLEDSSETFNQYKEGNADGVISNAEYRQQITGETLEEAQREVDKIKDKEPKLNQLVGGTFGSEPGQVINND